MARQRLTTQTLDDVQEKSAAVLAADLSTRLLGRGATESVLASMGAMLFKSMGPDNIRRAHRMAASILE